MSKIKIFSKKNFRDGAGWFFLFVGLVCYFVGYFVLDSKDSVWHEIIIKIADVLIIGVVLGYLTNAAQFIGIFKSELQDIIYAKDFLEKRNDIDQIWKEISKILFKNKFPTIHNELLDTINSYLPKDEASFYNDFEAHTSIVWIDKDKGIIKATDIVSFELIADSTKRFPYPLKTWSVLEPDERYPQPNLKIEINGAVYNNIEEKPIERDNDGNYCKEYVVYLEGSHKYEVKYTREKIYDVNKDFYLGLKAKYLIKNLRVCLELPEGLAAQFICRGTQEDFVDVNVCENRIEKKYKGIVLPRQGYIFALWKIN